jgi:hypothetical protein
MAALRLLRERNLGSDVQRARALCLDGYLGLASRTLANRGREDLIAPESLADT